MRGFYKFQAPLKKQSPLRRIRGCQIYPTTHWRAKEQRDTMKKTKFKRTHQDPIKVLKPDKRKEMNKYIGKLSVDTENNTTYQIVEIVKQVGN